MSHIRKNLFADTEISISAPKIPKSHFISRTTFSPGMRLLRNVRETFFFIFSRKKAHQWAMFLAKVKKLYFCAVLAHFSAFSAKWNFSRYFMEKIRSILRSNCENSEKIQGLADWQHYRKILKIRFRDIFWKNMMSVVCFTIA